MPDVVVVDDDEAIRRLITDALELEGHRVSAVPDGPRALDILRAYRPDCVVLDVMLPGMDGFEVLNQIRAEPDLADLPVALLTAATDDASVWRGWQAGASWFFTKPVDLDALRSFVEALQPGRKRAPAPTSSPYAIVSDRIPTGEAEESTLLEIIRALEAQALLFGAPLLVLTSVPSPDVLRDARMARLEMLADRGADVVVLGRRIPRRIGGERVPQLIPLRPDDVLRQEWVHVVCGPQLSSVLVGRTTPTGGGLWSFAVSHDVEVSALAAEAMLGRIPHLGLRPPVLAGVAPGPDQGTGQPEPASA